MADQYKTLMREEPHATNAKRQFGESGMYRMEGWYQEAQIAYQHALSLAERDSMMPIVPCSVSRTFARFVLKESIQTFDHVLKRTVDPTLLVSASSTST